jgi:hypothetical protein
MTLPETVAHPYRVNGVNGVASDAETIIPPYGVNNVNGVTPAYEIHPDIVQAPEDPGNLGNAPDPPAAPPDPGIFGISGRVQGDESNDREVFEL